MNLQAQRAVYWLVKKDSAACSQSVTDILCRLTNQLTLPVRLYDSYFLLSITSSSIYQPAFLAQSLRTQTLFNDSQATCDVCLFPVLPDKRQDRSVKNATTFYITALVICRRNTIKKASLNRPTPVVRMGAYRGLVQSCTQRDPRPYSTPPPPRGRWKNQNQYSLSCSLCELSDLVKCNLFLFISRQVYMYNSTTSKVMWPGREAAGLYTISQGRIYRRGQRPLSLGTTSETIT